MLNNEQLRQIETIGEHYNETLSGMLDSMDNSDAEFHFLRILFNALIVQFGNRRGPFDTSAFLRRTADFVEKEARERMQ